MADTASPSMATPDLIDGHSPAEIARYMVVYYAVLFGIVWYDFVILLTKEYRKIWRADWSLAKVAYLFNRYCMLALTIVVFVGLGMNRETSGCKSLLGWQNAFPILVYFFSGFILILRCYAIWGRSKIVAGVLCALHFSHVAVAGWTITQYVVMMQSRGQGPCIPKDTMIMSAFYTCFTSLVFDFVASGLALWRSCMVKKQYNAAGVTSAVMDNIVRNGTLYIVGTVFATCLNMSFRFLSARNFHTPMEGYAGGNLCVALGSILASRLALSLKIDEPDSKSSSHLLSSSSKDGSSSSHATSKTYKASRGSKTIGDEARTGVSQVAVTISTQTCVDSPSIGETEKKVWLSDSEEDVEMQSLDSRAVNASIENAVKQ